MSLAVITCHFNPAGYSNPRRNLLRFMRQMEAEGVPVFVAELAYDEAPWLLPEAPNVLRLRVSSSDVMWHKENLLNLVEKIVPEEFDALAWIDADVWFQRLDWFQATEEALLKHAVVQLFDKVVLTSMDGSFSSVSHGAGYAGQLTPGSTNPGFAWAARRSLWREAGGLFERAAIGGGDMLLASVWLPTEPSPYDWLHYKGVPRSLEMVRTWCAENGGCGGVEGTIWHEWHGDTQDRRYTERHGMMRELDIETQLVRREDGLLEFADSVLASLRAQIRAYFMSREEDGNGELRFASPAKSTETPTQRRPWMDARELAAMERLLKREDRMLEFGAGGSTAWIAGRVRELYSVEHNEEWVNRIIDSLPENVTLHLCPPAFPHKGFEPALPGQFVEYVRTPECLEVVFDACLVDGRSRIECALAAAPWIKSGGLLFFHDWFPRLRYTSRIAELEPFYELREEWCVRDSPQTLAVFVRRA